MCRGVNVGIHPKKLPQYSQNKDDEKYWQIQPKYLKKPENTSHLLMMQNRKFWAKNDQMLLSDKSNEPC